MPASDRRILKNTAMTAIREVQEILRHWDPINIKPGTFGPLNEYDGYAPHIVSLVMGGCTIKDLALHLENICVETMGLGASSPASSAHSLDFAARIVGRLRSVPAPP